MSSTERPPADPARLLEHWKEADVGDLPPGRVIANLKIAGMPDFLRATLTGLQEAEADTDSIAAIIDAWSKWERANLGPQALLDEIRAAGVEGFLERSVAAQQEAFGEQ
ncbi:MAG: hypothetical protein ACR2H3_11975 [Acidimicrobiales bacterium]